MTTIHRNISYWLYTALNMLDGDEDQNKKANGVL